MRILFVTPQPPHPTQGGAAIRNWHLMEAARNAGHTVDLLTFGLFQSDDGEACSAPPVTAGPSGSFARRISGLVSQREPDLAHRLGADGTARNLPRR